MDIRMEENKMKDIKVYLIERRKTVGSFKTIAFTYNKETAIKIFEEAKKNEGFGKGYTEKLSLTKPEQKKYPDVIAYGKVGDSHCNITLRVREVSVEA